MGHAKTKKIPDLYVNVRSMRMWVMQKSPDLYSRSGQQAGHSQSRL